VACSEQRILLAWLEKPACSDEERGLSLSTESRRTKPINKIYLKMPRPAVFPSGTCHLRLAIAALWSVPRGRLASYRLPLRTTFFPPSRLPTGGFPHPASELQILPLRFLTARHEVRCKHPQSETQGPRPPVLTVLHHPLPTPSPFYFSPFFRLSPVARLLFFLSVPILFLSVEDPSSPEKPEPACLAQGLVEHSHFSRVRGPSCVPVEVVSARTAPTLVAGEHQGSWSPSVHPA